jgi:hypothetical protein
MVGSRPMRALLFCGFTTCSAVGVIAACTTESAPAITTVDAAVPDEPDAADAGVVDAAPDALFPLGQVCPPFASNEACDKCIQESCCETRSALFGRDAGAALVACTQSPEFVYGEDGLRDCFDRSPDAVNDYLAHLACASHRCEAACENTPNECGACGNERCLPQNIACELSRDCFLAQQCGAACDVGSEPCIRGCVDKYDGGAAVMNELIVCTLNSCATECR